MKKTKVTFDVDKLVYSVELVRALAHPLRIKILEFIDKKGVVSFIEVFNKLQLDKSIILKHLRIMRTSKIVDTNRQGEIIIYYINYKLIERTVNAVNKFLGKSEDTNSIDTLDEYYYETLEVLIDKDKYDELENFGNKLFLKSTDVDNEINEIINENFWDLI